MNWKLLNHLDFMNSSMDPTLLLSILCIQLPPFKLFIAYNPFFLITYICIVCLLNHPNISFPSPFPLFSLSLLSIDIHEPLSIHNFPHYSSTIYNSTSNFHLSTDSQSFNASYASAVFFLVTGINFFLSNKSIPIEWLSFQSDSNRKHDRIESQTTDRHKKSMSLRFVSLHKYSSWLCYTCSMNYLQVYCLIKSKFFLLGQGIRL